MRQIQFLGAAGGVTGSAYLLTGDNHEQILIDFGMFQGSLETETQNEAALTFNPNEIKAVLLTHAHLDHCGRLPFLYKSGYRHKIYSTEATKMITNISLLDSAKISREKASGFSFTKKDVAKIIKSMEIVEYDRPFPLGEFTVIYHNAGHILGSASIEVLETNNQEKSIIFSGDLGNSPQDLIQPTEYFSKAQYVVIESTYGDTVHPEEDVSLILQNKINQIERNNGVLLIPAFSVERTQEIIHRIGHLRQSKRINSATPVYLDSPMAIEVTDIFKMYPKLYNTELSQDIHPFDFENLFLTKSSAESKSIRKVQGPKIIIAGSGMMNGGRILHHLKSYISFPTTELLIVGYQAEGTLGRKIEDGKNEIEIEGKFIPIRAHVTKIESLSSHADQPKLVEWIKHIQGIESVFITHGEENQRQVLATKINSELEINSVVIPNLGQVVNL